MKPADLEVYDRYLGELNKLITFGATLATIPFDDLEKVCDRMALTGQYRLPGHDPVTMPLGLVDAQRKLIQAAKAFRDILTTHIAPTDLARRE